MRQLIHNSVHASLISPRVHIVTLDLPTCHDANYRNTTLRCMLIRARIGTREQGLYHREECSRSECIVNMHYYRYSSIHRVVSREACKTSLSSASTSFSTKLRLAYTLYNIFSFKLKLFRNITIFQVSCCKRRAPKKKSL